MSINPPGRPIGTAEKYFIGAVIGGSEIVAEQRSDQEPKYITAFTMKCGKCKGIFDIHYSNLSIVARYTDIISCGCLSDSGKHRGVREHETKKLFRVTAQNVETSYLVLRGNRPHNDSMDTAIMHFRMYINELRQTRQEVVLTLRRAYMAKDSKKHINDALNIIQEIPI